MPGNILGKANEIGNFADYVHVPYASGNEESVMSFLKTAYYHVHGRSFCYPGNNAGSVTLTAGAGAWGSGGSIIEVVPANALNVSDFDLHWINLINGSADGEYFIEIYKGLAAAEVLIGATRGWRDSAFLGGQTGTSSKRIQVPQQPKNERISCKLYTSGVGADTLDVSFEGHYYAL